MRKTSPPPTKKELFFTLLDASTRTPPVKPEKEAGSVEVPNPSELIEVGMEVLLGDVSMGSTDGVFDVRPEALNVVRMGRATDVLVVPVLDLHVPVFRQSIL